MVAGVRLIDSADLGWDSANFEVYSAKLRMDSAKFGTYSAESLNDSAKPQSSRTTTQNKKNHSSPKVRMVTRLSI
jgi:hypothetical protein